MHQLDQLLLRVRVIEQGPVAPVARPLELLADRGLEVDHGAAFGEHAPIVDVDHRAAARGDHHAVKTREALDRLLFAQPEPRLALFLEDEGDVDARSGLDVRVAVVEGESQQAREMAAHGGLAGAHGADQEDVGLGQHGRRS